jgi:hypothetical protein
MILAIVGEMHYKYSGARLFFEYVFSGGTFLRYFAGNI